MVYKVTEGRHYGVYTGSRLVDDAVHFSIGNLENRSETVIDDSGTVTIVPPGGQPVTVPICNLSDLGIDITGAENGDVLVFDAIQGKFVSASAVEGGGQIEEDGSPDNNPGGTGLDFDGGTF